MERQRVRDGLVGAALAVAVLVVAVLVALWWLTRPAEPDASPAPPASTAASPDGRAPAAEPPADLADDETWLGDLTLDAGTVVAAGSLLRDVQAVGRDVRTGPDGLLAGALSVDATVPFDVVAEQLGAGTTVRAAPGGQATVERTVRFAGRALDVVATGTVEVVDGRLVVEPRSVDIGGPDLLSDAIGGLVRRLSTIEHEVEGLPEGLVLQDVVVQEDGFRAALEGEDVRLVS
jgi:hypothetical protein